MKLIPKYNCSITWTDENNNIIEVTDLTKRNKIFKLNYILGNDFEEDDDSIYNIRNQYTLFTIPKIYIDKLMMFERMILLTQHRLFEEYVDKSGLIKDYDVFIKNFKSMNIILLYNILNSAESRVPIKYFDRVRGNMSKTQEELLAIQNSFINTKKEKYIYNIMKNELNKHEIEYMKYIKTEYKNIELNNISIGQEIYFIQQGKNGPIKIGFTDNIEKRLKELQTANPYKLNLLLCINGNLKSEKELHKRFEQHRLNGEWFEPVEEILDYIYSCKFKKVACQ
jgi:hypothetical protein